MTERWVVDASPLILLGKAGGLEWLPKLGELVIPRPVADEVFAGSENDPARKWLEDRGAGSFADDLEVPEEILAWDLGPGETAVLSWALRDRKYEAVLDDAAARRCASVYGIRFRGTLSLVALAKQRGLLSACRPIFGKLLEAGLFISPDLVDQVAASVGE